MRKLGAFLCAACAVAILMPGAPAQARPQYNKAFKETYGKKVVSDYGKALAEALGAKNEKDEKKIVDALNTVAKKEYEAGKTYGSLLEKGELPPPAK